MKTKKRGWDEAISNLHKPDKVPEGYKVPEQIAAEIGKSMSRTRALIREMLGAKLIEMKRFKVIRDVRLLPVAHYRLKK